MDNKYYIVRCDHSGVFAGNIKSRNGSEVCMTNARCIWYWDGAATLLQMAKDGVNRPDNCKFTVAVDEIELLDAIEIIPCTQTAEQCIKAVAEWKR